MNDFQFIVTVVGRPRNFRIFDPDSRYMFREKKRNIKKTRESSGNININITPENSISQTIQLQYYPIVFFINVKKHSLELFDVSFFVFNR